jgi:hypothetical protein
MFDRRKIESLYIKRKTFMYALVSRRFATSSTANEVRAFLRKTIRVLDKDLAIIATESPSLFSHSVHETYLPAYNFFRNTAKIRDRGMTITFKNCPSVFLANVEYQLEPRFLFLKSCSDAAGKPNFPWHIHIQNSPEILLEPQDDLEKRLRSNFF